MGMMRFEQFLGTQWLTRRTSGPSIGIETEYQSGQYFHRRPVGWWPHDCCHVSYGEGGGRQPQAGFDGGALD
jgi:hypothetical protein